MGDCWRFEDQINQLQGAIRVSWVVTSPFYHVSYTLGRTGYFGGNVGGSNQQQSSENIFQATPLRRARVQLSLLPSLHKLTDVAHADKKMAMLPLLYLFTWFPQKKKKHKKTEDQPGWQCQWNVSGETGKETVTMLLLLYWLATWQLKTKLQTKLFSTS